MPATNPQDSEMLGMQKKLSMMTITVCSGTLRACLRVEGNIAAAFPNIFYKSESSEIADILEVWIFIPPYPPAGDHTMVFL